MPSFGLRTPAKKGLCFTSMVSSYLLSVCNTTTKDKRDVLKIPPKVNLTVSPFGKIVIFGFVFGHIYCKGFSHINAKIDTPSCIKLLHL